MYLKKLILALSLFFVALIGLEKLVDLFSDEFLTEHSKLVIGSLKTVLILVVVFLIGKEKIFNRDYFFRHKIVTAILLLAMTYGAISNTLTQAKAYQVTLTGYQHYSFLFANMTTGFLEELFFRILIFGYVSLLLQRPTAKNYYREVILTSFLFGINHFYNLRYVTSPLEVISVANQVLFALSFGVILQSIFFRFNNIMLNGTLHGLINYNQNSFLNLFKLKRPIIDDGMTFAQELTQSVLITAGFIIVIVLPIMYFCVRNRENKMIRYGQQTLAADV